MTSKYKATHPKRQLPPDPTMRMKVYVWHGHKILYMQPGNVQGRVWALGYNRIDALGQLRDQHGDRAVWSLLAPPNAGPRRQGRMQGVAIYRATALSIDFEAYLNGTRRKERRVYEPGERLIAFAKPKSMRRVK